MRCDPLSGTSFEPCETHSDIKVESAISTCEKFTGLFYPEYLYRHLANNNTWKWHGKCLPGRAALLSIDTPDMPAKWTSMFAYPKRQTDLPACLLACLTGSCLLQTDRQMDRQADEWTVDLKIQKTFKVWEVFGWEQTRVRLQLSLATQFLYWCERSNGKFCLNMQAADVVVVKCNRTMSVDCRLSTVETL